MFSKCMCCNEPFDAPFSKLTGYCSYCWNHDRCAHCDALLYEHVYVGPQKFKCLYDSSEPDTLLHRVRILPDTHV